MKKSIMYLLILCSSVLLIGCSQNAKMQVTYESVDAITQEAESAYENGDYTKALNLYADAIRTNPLSVDAQIGAAKCQMALKNFEMVSENLSAASMIDPQVPEIYDLYLELAETSKDFTYARAALNLAKNNHVESLLARMPGKPELSLKEGSYDSRQELKITAEEGAEIIVSEQNENTWCSYIYDGKPIRLLSGKTTVTAYCIKDGVPGEEVSAVYHCQFDPAEIKFSDPVIEEAVRLSLDRASGPITDLDCEGMTWLSCYHHYSWDDQGDDALTVKSLEDLKYFPKLQGLSFDDIKIDADLKTLSTCRLLYSVTLSNCSISDISFVKGLPQLSTLYLSGNEELKDISPSAECKTLVGLDISGTGVTDLSPLFDKEMESLTLTLGDKMDGSVVSRWKDSLSSLSLYNCGGRNLSWLKEQTGLKSLFLTADNNQYSYEQRPAPLKGLEFLSGLKNLTSLELSGLGDASSLEYVKSLKHLRYLSVMMNDWETKVPEDLIVELQKVLPGCMIYY